MRKRTKYQRKRDRELLVLCLPTAIKTLIFAYLPMVGIYMAFVNYKPGRGIFGSDFVGLENFRFLFESIDAQRIFSNTVFYNVMFIVLGTIVSVALALLLFEINNKISLKIIQTSFFLPYFISWILVSIILQSLLDSTGLLTNLIYTVTGTKISFYTTPAIWRTIIILVYIWKSAGVSAIIFYATLISCDKSIYEAAEIDGASRWQKMLYISIPYLKTMIIITAIMSGANILRSDLGLFFYASQDIANLYPTTDVIDTYIWRILRKSGEFKVGTAVGLVQGVVGLFLTLFANKIVAKIEPSAALFYGREKHE